MKVILFLIIAIPFLGFAQNNSNTFFLNDINDNSFFNKNSLGNYEFSVIYKNTKNVNELVKNIKKSNIVESCDTKNNILNIKTNTSDFNLISKLFINNNIIYLDYNNNIIPLEYIKIDKTTIPPPDNNIDMTQRDNVLYHEYVIYSIKYKLHYMQQNLQKLAHAAKTGYITRSYNQILKEQDSISELNQAN